MFKHACEQCQKIVDCKSVTLLDSAKDFQTFRHDLSCGHTLIVKDIFEKREWKESRYTQNIKEGK